jgi:hypothetical protein
MKVSVSDNVETKECLTNQKPWFNGMKTFSSVKVNPAPLNDPNVLEVFVVDEIATETGLA